MQTHLRGTRRTPAATVLLAACLLSLFVGALACRRGDRGPGFTTRITAFAAHDSVLMVTDMDLVITEPQGWWVYCQGDRVCWVERYRDQGAWKVGRLITYCDMGRYIRHAFGDTLHAVVPMSKNDTISVGIFASKTKPPLRMNREELLGLLRWSSAVVFDSSEAVSMKEWEVRRRY